MALYRLLNNNDHRVECLLTTVNDQFERVSMHGLRTSLLQRQVESIEIEHQIVRLEGNVSNEVYESLMSQKLNDLKQKGFTCAGFGDIFLEELKVYRETQLRRVGIQCVFPLWKSDTSALIRDFISSGFKTIVICVNAAHLDSSFLGRLVDEDFLKDLPDGVDPCGENGEFHTFCFDAPFYKNPILFEKGETVYREYDHNGVKSGFYFLDLLPADK